MNTSFLPRCREALRSFAHSDRVVRVRRRRLALGLEMLEDRIALSLVPQMVLDINHNAFSSNPTQLVAIGSTVFFAADDGVNGVELWKSDGTATGTTLVKDINPGTTRVFDYYGNPSVFPNSSDPGNLTNVSGTLFFTAYNGTSGVELWKSDGTAAGTTLVKDIYPGTTRQYAYYTYSDVPNSSSPNNLTSVNGTLFFTANDGTNARELWKSDGTAAGTTLVKDIYPGQSRQYDAYGRWWYVTNSSDPGELRNLSGTLFFSAADGTGRHLWKSDGSAAGTVGVGTVGNVQELTNVNGTLYFRGLDGAHGDELWKSDGTAAGTVLVKDICPGTNGSYPGWPDPLTNLNGTLFFAATDGTHGWELWKSDGTSAGTALVKDIYPGSFTGYGGGPYNSYPSNLTNVNGTLFFTANDGTHGLQVWKSDGTPAGTTLAGYSDRPGSLSPSNMTFINGTLFFTANDGTHGWQLWQSDGTAAGTVPVANLFAHSVTNVGGTLLFTADDGIHGQELWKLVAGPGQNTTLNVSGFPATITAGAAGNFTVTAKKGDGTADTSYRGTVQFTSSDPQAVLPGNYTFTAADNGVHTFSITLKTSGSQSITAGDTIVPTGAGTEAGITVTAAAASRLTLAGFPSPITAGSAGSFIVTATDSYGNRATGYTGTVRFTSSDNKAVVPGNYTFTTADAGTHSFSAMLKTAGTQSLTVTDTVSATILATQSIAVNPSAASRLILSAPSSVNAGAKFSLTVTVVDAYGNVVTGYRGKVAFRSSDSTASLPKNYTFTASDMGMHTFTGLVQKKKGKLTITVTDTLDGSLTASTLIIVV
jgi:ELWxxDGT repeat protein